MHLPRRASGVKGDLHTIATANYARRTWTTLHGVRGGVDEKHHRVVSDVETKEPATLGSVDQPRSRLRPVLDRAADARGILKTEAPPVPFGVRVPPDVHTRRLRSSSCRMIDSCGTLATGPRARIASMRARSSGVKGPPT
jgi:hypothetical protein